MKKKLEWWLAILAVVSLIGAGLTGKIKKEGFQSDLIQTLYPDSAFENKKINPEIFILQNEKARTVKYAVISEGTGYAGKIRCFGIYNQKHELTDIHITHHSETPSYYKKVVTNNYLSSFKKKKITELVNPEELPDAISGATKTCSGLNEAILNSSFKLAELKGIQVTRNEQNTKIQIGYREILVVLLFSLGILARTNKLRYKNYIQWVVLFSGLVFLGFVLNQPITLTRISSILTGFWSDWQNELYIYLLVGGAFLILLTTGKNIYCHSICPLGATQEILGKLGKPRNENLPFTRFWIWFQRSLAWLALLLAVYFQNPTISEYEVYGAIFQFTASKWLFILAILVIIMSTIQKRPWCNFLCPIKPVFALVILLRYRIKSLWKRI